MQEVQDYTYVSYKVDTTGYNKDKIHSKTYTNTKGMLYTILNNDSTCITFDDNETRVYRSIVLDDTSNIVCFSPMNGVPLDTFIEKYPQLTSDIYANEIMEGTMINLFYEKRSQTWEISTRGAIGGNYWFYRTKYANNVTENDVSKQTTFRQMFMEALRYNKYDELDTVQFLDLLPKNYCYSFVLQHPENHIVLVNEAPRLFLVSVYDLADDNRCVFIPPTIYESWECFSNIPIEFPQHYSSDSYDTIRQKYASIQADYSSMGVMFTNITTGDRASMENPVYEEVKKLRGNNPNLQYQYFCLERSEQTQSFLNYFPIYKKIFGTFSRQYHDFITNVHQSYFSYYVKKEGIPIAKKYFIHASKIHHNIYLPSIGIKKVDIETVKVEGYDNASEITIEEPIATPMKYNKIVITRKVVKDYFDALTPSEILYYLSYDKIKIEKAKHSTADDQVDVSA